MRHPRFLASSLFGVLALAAPAPARAADPIMPLSEVRAGMRCTSLSVVQGLEPAGFDVEVLDVVEGDPSSDGPRILIEVSGAAVDRTGIGPGFSGSPVYCPDAQGRPANIGAISNSIGEYGGAVVLATPIESILGNPVDAPARARRRPGLMRRARRLTALTVSGLSRPLASALTHAAARRGTTVIASPAGPLTRFPPQVLRPGSAMSVGYSSGDLAIGGLGTVAYTDGNRLWGFGHEMDAVGRRSLLLQDAYVYRVIANPNQGGELGSTYKLAAPAHDVGTVSNDALTAVVGRVGLLPRTTLVHVSVRDEDTRALADVRVRVADETDVDDPLGDSLVSLVAPLAALQGGSGVLKSAPGRVSGNACARIVVQELGARPLRFCNRFVGDGGGGGGELDFTNVVASGAAVNLKAALALIDAYTSRSLHVTSARSVIRVHRGADLVYMRSLDLPARVRPGERVTARLTVQRLHGPRQARRIELRMPRGLERGSHRMILRGPAVDSTADQLLDIISIDLGDGTGDERDRDGSPLDAGPQTPAELREAIDEIERYDGLSLFVDRVRGDGERAYRDPDLRVAGRASDRVTVVR